MNQAVPTFEQSAADKLALESDQITSEWVRILTTQLEIEPQRILPHDDLMDHVPEVLARAADFLLVPDPEKLTAERFVVAEMRDIARLRRTQGLNVQEIIREFDELARLLDAFALRWVDEYPGSPNPKSVGRVFGRLNRVPLLMGQITVAAVEEERNNLLRQLALAEEEERLRISRELHDQMGQTVTALLLELRALRHGPVTDEQSARIASMEQLASQIALEVHQLALDLRPSGLGTLGLPAAIENLMHEWSERNGIAADLQCTGMEGERYPDEIETVLFRIVQEALTNVVKHAKASHVGVVMERRGGTLSIIVEDDGDGFDVEAVLAAPEKARRLGVQGMRERIARMGGTLEIESSPGAGTSLFIRAPIPGGAAVAPAGNTTG